MVGPDKLYAGRRSSGCRPDEVAGRSVGEVATLGKTLAAWKPEILAHHATGASAGPTEAMNLLIEKVRRVGHGFKSFHNYRLRLLLHREVDRPARASVGLRPHPRRRRPDQLVA